MEKKKRRGGADVVASDDWVEGRSGGFGKGAGWKPAVRYERQGFPPELLLAQALQRAVADLAEGAVQEMVAR